MCYLQETDLKNNYTERIKLKRWRKYPCQLWWFCITSAYPSGTPFPRIPFPGWAGHKGHLHKICKVEVKHLRLCSEGWWRVRHCCSLYTSWLICWPQATAGLPAPLSPHWIFSCSFSEFWVQMCRRCGEGCPLTWHVTHIVEIGERERELLSVLASLYHIGISFPIACPSISVPVLDSEATDLHILLNQLPQLLLTSLW